MTALISFPCVLVSKKLHVFFWLCYITNGKRLSEQYWVIVALGKIAKHSRSFSHTGLSPHAIISLLSNPPRATIYAIENVSMFAWRLVCIKKKNVFYCLLMTYLSREKKEAKLFVMAQLNDKFLPVVRCCTRSFVDVIISCFYEMSSKIPFFSL